jgi:hypothetical protein
MITKKIGATNPPDRLGLPAQQQQDITNTQQPQYGQQQHIYNHQPQSGILKLKSAAIREERRRYYY